MEHWYEDDHDKIETSFDLTIIQGIFPQVQPQTNIKGLFPHNVERLVRGACGEDQCGDQTRFVTGFRIMPLLLIAM